MRRRSGRPRYRWAALNAKLNGQLADLLVEWDEQATPWAEVVDRLQVMTGERVMIVTARRWTERAYSERTRSLARSRSMSIPDNSPEVRRRFLGATDVAAIVGSNPYRTPLQVWLEKTGHAPAAEPNAAMKRGLLFEPVVAQMHTQTTGVSTVPADRVVHPQFEFLAASPDRLACPVDAAPYYVELKTHNPWLRDNYGPQGTDAVPDHEYLQVMWQLHVGLRAHAIEAGHADLAALFGTDELGIWHIEYNEELGDALESRAVRFWQDHVLPEVPPEPTGADVDLMRRAYPLHTERVIRADEQLESLINALREARAELARQEQHVNALTATIQAAMGDAAVLEFTGGKITWRTSKPTVRRTCDYDALKAADPDLYARVVTEQEVPGVRRFGVPRSWGKGDE